MSRATMCLSSAGQLYEYNFWYAGQDGTSSILTCIPYGH